MKKFQPALEYQNFLTPLEMPQLGKYSCSSVMCTYSRIRELLSLAKNFELSIAFLLTSSTPKNLYSCRQSGLSFTSYRFTNTKFKMADPMDFLGISAEEKVCLCH